MPFVTIATKKYTTNMNTLTKIIITILIITAGVFAYLYYTSYPNPNDTLIIHDTTTITRYETQLQKDTVTKWYERITIKESKPTVIYQQKIDTVFLEKVKSYDLILGIYKKGTNLRVFALNKDKMLLKEELFEDVYNNFTAFSAEDKVVVKSQRFYWNGLEAGYEHKRPVNDLKTYVHSIDLMTGINYIDRLSLDAGTEFDLTNKEFNLKAKLTVRIF